VSPPRLFDVEAWELLQLLAEEVVLRVLGRADRSCRLTRDEIGRVARGVLSLVLGDELRELSLAHRF
jgi:hypothetical protein